MHLDAVLLQSRCSLLLLTFLIKQEVMNAAENCELGHICKIRQVSGFLLIYSPEKYM